MHPYAVAGLLAWDCRLHTVTKSSAGLRQEGQPLCLHVLEQLDACLLARRNRHKSRVQRLHCKETHPVLFR